ncbi:MAG TPA: CRISPR system precrRNA processing endoribonuclease RAMP protein Cas6, partial [Thermoanaerobaculia bacterium]
LEHAGTVRIAASDLHWFDCQRYSNRQGRKIDIGGLLGSLELEGDLAPLAPLLRTAELVHVGKGATFGLGKLEVVPTSGEPGEGGPPPLPVGGGAMGEGD